MRALHDSRSQSYRLTYGSVPAGGAVRLVLDAWVHSNKNYKHIDYEAFAQKD